MDEGNDSVRVTLLMCVVRAVIKVRNHYQKICYSVFKTSLSTEYYLVLLRFIEKCVFYNFFNLLLVIYHYKD